MIAAVAPLPHGLATKPVVADSVQYVLRVVDSTCSPHGAVDTRKGTSAGRTHQDGAGYYTATNPATDRRSMVIGQLALP